ncbi:very short patch repair endonuclease [Opitutus sp. GAS368]|uniref:very short patch repair endonuclease n=1 Tax=Opitutus sp. GAS368 TaxID=1882749 RepID=UPI0031B601A9
MSRIRGTKNKGTELRLIQVFRVNGITGWRRGCSLSLRVSGLKSQVSGLAGHRSTGRVRPDFIFPRLRVAVFVDGCFWHGCPRHATWPRTRASFWKAKIEGNRTRDRLVGRELRRSGWRVIRIWEHELAKRNSPRLFRRLSVLQN